MIKKIATIGTAITILAMSALPAFASANQHASCVGSDFSVEGPQGLVKGKVHEFLEFAKDTGVPFGSLVKEFAQLHLGSREACGE